MSNYLTITEEERKEMLAKVGVKSLDELYDDVPQDLKLRKLDLPEGKSTQETMDILSAMAEKNVVYKTIMRGAGAYNHFIPSIVKNLSTRSEFLTAYTPYQAEMSQGILQSIFEYQTMICNLTGMDVSNASVYSGATAAAEGVLMTQERGRTEIVIAEGSIRPDTLATIETYIRRRGMEIKFVPTKDGVMDYDMLKTAVGEKTACVYLEQPNYYGMIEDAAFVGDVAHGAGAKFVMGCNPMTLGVLKTPRDCGADIAVGDAQPFGMPMSFGGPYLGYMACTNKEMRKLPGRIVGETVDSQGERAFVLTLQAREQHIRREKSLSNICSNQAHCALVAGMYLAAMGKQGLIDVANSCLSLAHYAAEEMTSKGKAELKFHGAFFHEFVTVTKAKADKILSKLAKEGILGGLKIGDNEILWCMTEMVSKADIDRVVEIMGRA